MKNDRIYSSYWMDADEVAGESSVDRVVKLAGIRRAISNFVRILTNDDKINVKFSSGADSYTDGKTVVIAADDNPDKFDSMVGLALHEGSHCLLTNFNFLRQITTDRYVFYGALHPDLRKRVDITTLDQETFLNTMDTLLHHIKTIMNVIEDRRIDSYVYRTAPGYQPYYDALYKRYFFSKDVDNNMRFNPEWREPTVENYVTWLMMMFSDAFDPTALKGLDVMVNRIDLPNISRLDAYSGPTSPSHDWEVESSFVHPTTGVTHYTYTHSQFADLWTISNQIMLDILQYADMPLVEKEPESEDGDGIEFEGMDDEGELENLDIPKGKFNKDKAQRALDKIRDLLNGKLKKRKLSKADQAQMESLESANAQMTENSDSIFGKVPCLVTRKIDKTILSSRWFPFSRVIYNSTTPIEDPYAKNGVVAGVRMGQILAHRLQLRNDPTITHFTRQPHGKIDRRILAQLGMDITSVFKRTTIEHFHPVMLHLTLDASGSMTGVKWERVMTVATALAYAAEKVRNLDVVITIRGTMRNDMPIVAVLHDSRVDKFHKAKLLFPYIQPANSTPEGLCYLATLGLITECAATHSVYMINFSDGEPGCEFVQNGTRMLYSGPKAISQTKNMVKVITDAGVKVMSYFITQHDAYAQTSKNVFKQMYGLTSEFVNIKNATQVIKTLNKLLLNKDS